MVWTGVQWCGVEFWSLQKLIFVFKYRYPQFQNTAIPKNRCKIDIFCVNSHFFATSLKILTPAPHVVHLTNIRYVYKLCKFAPAGALCVRAH